MSYKTYTIDELLTLRKIIPESNCKNDILKSLLKRNDSKDIIKIMFPYFLINIDSDTLITIRNENNKEIFEDLIKNNISKIISECIVTNNVDELCKFCEHYFSEILDNFNLILDDEKFPKHLGMFLGSKYENKIFENYKDIIVDKVYLSLKDKKYSGYLFDNLVLCFFLMLKKLDKNYIDKNEDKITYIISEFINQIDIDRLEALEDEPSFILNTICLSAKKNKKIDELLEKNIDFVISLFTLLSKDKIEELKLFDFFKCLINELINSQNLTVKDIKYHNGGFSNVFIIGDKVVKLGEKNTYEIPYSKRILQPLIRHYLKSARKSRGGYYENYQCLEVFERVDTKNISEDEAYMIFKELLEEGILWADAATRNLGRLLKPNKVYLKDSYTVRNGYKQDYYVDDESIGIITGEKKKDILKNGELVITDVDEIYDISDLNLIFEINQRIKENYDIDEYDVDNFIRKHLCIDPTNDYFKYMKMYINEQKEKILGKKM